MWSQDRPTGRIRVWRSVQADGTSAEEPGASDEHPDVLDTSGAASASIRGGTVRVAGYAGGLLMALISAPLLIRHLGVIQYGRYATALSIVAVTAGVTEFGLRDAATREYATSSGRQRDDLLASALGLRLVMSVVGALVAVVFSATAGYGTTLTVGVLIAAAGQLVNNVQMVTAVPLAVQLRLVTTTLLDLSQQALTVVLTIAFVVAGLTILPFFLIQLIAPIPALIATARLVRSTTRLRIAMSRRWIISLLRLTLPFTAASVVFSVYFRISIILVSLISTKLQTGYFATSFRVIEALVYVPSLLVTAALPILSRAARVDSARFGYAVARLFDVAFIGGAACGLLLALGAPVVSAVLAGHAGHHVVPVLRIQALVMPSDFLVAVGGYALLASRRHGPVVISMAIGLSVNVGLLLLLVPSDGARGAAIAGASGEAAIAVSMIATLVSVEHVRPSLRTLVVVLAASGAGVAVTILSGLSALPAVLVAGGIFSIAIVVSRVIPPEILDAIRHR